MNEFIEKLINELEKLGEHCLYMNNWQGQTAICDAIEIVNQLAEEYNNDFCEWWHWRTINDIPMYRTTCLNEFSKNLAKKYKFCPHCGKKIKVVE